MPVSSPIELILLRNRFYQRQYFLALGALALNMIVVVALISVLIFLKRNPTKPVYFATDRVGRLLQVVPVTEPNMALDETISWAIEAAETTYSYDFINYPGEFQNAQKYFINWGWDNYIKALNRSNNIVALKDRKMIVIAQVVGKPKILAQGLLAGAYAWKFEMPMLVTYMLPPYSNDSRFVNPLTVTMIVQRQPILQSYQGLGIVQTIAVMPTGNNAPAELSNSATNG